jgi:sterol 24-C-methyltransferase
MFWTVVVAALVVFYFRETLASLLKFVPYFTYSHVDKLDKVTDNFVKDYKSDDKSNDARRAKYTATTETFYNLITDFYEYGWGQSFHFSPMYVGETFEAATTRYEHWFASQLGDVRGKKVLDVGCGIGGPMRKIARFAGCNIVGVNITAEHIQRATRYNQREGVKNCEFIRADFNKIPVPDNTFDAIYDFEATLHSTDRLRTFTELYRVLKPGGRIVSAQYCLLKDYDEKNEQHRDIIRRIDNTNGCYCAGNTVDSTTKAFEGAGFKIIRAFDAFEEQGVVPFHEVFVSKTGGRFFGTRAGRLVTTTALQVGESLRVLPRGTVQVQEMLIGAAESFTEAGEQKLITPGYVYICTK